MRWRADGMMAVLLAIVASTSVAAQVSPTNQAAIELASARGRLIYAYDQAAWHGTDDLLAQSPDIMQKLGGWIVDGPADAPALIFFDRDAEHPHALYSATFRDGRLVASHLLGPGEDGTVSPARVALIRARDLALAAVNRAQPPRCSGQSLNSVVLPPSAPGAAIPVYVLEPQPDMRTFPIGGNYRLDVDPSGQVSAPHKSANTCFNLAIPEGPRPVMFTATHLLDPVPTEIHVFASLAAHLPVAVITTDQSMWLVDGDRITPMPMPKDK